MFCEFCGEKMEPGMKFCPKCGAKVENGEAEEPTVYRVVPPEEEPESSFGTFSEASSTDNKAGGGKEKKKTRRVRRPASKPEEETAEEVGEFRKRFKTPEISKDEFDVGWKAYVMGLIVFLIVIAGIVALTVLGVAAFDAFPEAAVRIDEILRSLGY